MGEIFCRCWSLVCDDCSKQKFDIFLWFLKILKSTLKMDFVLCWQNYARRNFIEDWIEYGSAFSLIDGNKNQFRFIHYSLLYMIGYPMLITKALLKTFIRCIRKWRLLGNIHIWNLRFVRFALPTIFYLFFYCFICLLRIKI